MGKRDPSLNLYYKAPFPPEGDPVDAEGLTAGIATIRRVETSERLVALTFDDGPDATWTPDKLRALKDHGATATFFVVGQVVDRLPETAREIVTSGNEMANHSFSHPWLSRLGHAGVVSQLERTKEAALRATGAETTLFRPPYGDYDATVLRAAAAASYGHNILWDIDPSDYRRPSAGAIAAHILSRVKPGSIVVLHDGIPETARTLPGILAELRSRGYRAVTVSRLLEASPPAPEPSPPPDPVHPEGPSVRRTLSPTSPYMRGDDVRAVQEALLRRGITPGPIDGIYGPKTAQAVGVFQTREKLPVTRVVTPEVYQRLGIAG